SHRSPYGPSPSGHGGGLVPWHRDCGSPRAKPDLCPHACALGPWSSRKYSTVPGLFVLRFRGRQKETQREMTCRRTLERHTSISTGANVGRRPLSVLAARRRSGPTRRVHSLQPLVLVEILCGQFLSELLPGAFCSPGKRKRVFMQARQVFDRPPPG